jgi:hypothetical protein
MQQNFKERIQEAAKKALDQAFGEKDTAELLGVAVQTLRNWRCQRRGPAYCKLGRKIVYFGKFIDDYKNKCLVDPEQ